MTLVVFTGALELEPKEFGMDDTQTLMQSNRGAPLVRPPSGRERKFKTPASTYCDDPALSFDFLPVSVCTPGIPFGFRLRPKPEALAPKIPKVASKRHTRYVNFNVKRCCRTMLDCRRSSSAHSRRRNISVALKRESTVTLASSRWY